MSCQEVHVISILQHTSESIYSVTVRYEYVSCMVENIS